MLKKKKMYRNIYSNTPGDIMGRIDKHMKDLGFPNSFHIPEDILSTPLLSNIRIHALLNIHFFLPFFL